MHNYPMNFYILGITMTISSIASYIAVKNFTLRTIFLILVAIGLFILSLPIYLP